MKERPILFSGPMILALLEGRKTQTRRVMKEQPSEGWTPHGYDEVHKMVNGVFAMKDGSPIVIGWGPTNDDGSEAYACPHGQPGDRLWVKETFSTLDCHHGQVVYRADGQTNLTDMVWKPSIFMPRKLSRITLEITAVRVERLQDISEADALAEGVFAYESIVNGQTLYTATENDHRAGKDTAVGAYAVLWESINGKGSWAKNPWVWIVEFKRI